MLVEDDVNTIEIVTYIFERRGYVVRVILGHDYANVIASFQPSLVLLDIKFHGYGDGELISKEIKKTSDCRVILFSAVIDIEQIATRACADGYISKPFDIDSFEKQIDSYFIT